MKGYQYIILGAGSPHRGEEPSVLRDTQKGTPVLNWTLDALGAEQKDVTFVAGYHAETIRERFPSLPMIINPDWAETGSGASLLSAPFNLDQPLVACYGDILFRAKHVHALAQSNTPVTLLWDSAWRQRYANRSIEDLHRCEKISVVGDRVLRFGSDLPLDWSDGEFVGLVCFQKEALQLISELKNTDEYNPVNDLRTKHLSGLVEYLRVRGLTVGAIDVQGDWAEVNAPQDVAHFVLGTKAETLQRLRGMVDNAVIQEQISFEVLQWQRDPESIIRRVHECFKGLRVVIRSSARSEDGFTASNAGAYTSLLGVELNSEFKESVDQVVASYGKVKSTDQVLIQPMVEDVSLSGVAFTRTLEHGAPWYIINYETSGATDGITSGGVKDHDTLVLRRTHAGKKLPDSCLDRVVAAITETESLLGYDALDIEFALDCNEEVHIFQVRPLTIDRGGVTDAQCEDAIEQAIDTWQRLSACPVHIPGDVPSMYGIMPDWNPAEIIGTCPGLLAENLYRYLIMDEIWAAQRAEYGYRDVRPSPLLVSFAGRPYVDVRASFASFIPATVSDDLAGHLLSFYLSWLADQPALHDKIEFEVIPTCLTSAFPNWSRRLREDGGFSDEQITSLKDGLYVITKNAFFRYKLDLNTIEQLSKRFNRIQSQHSLDPLESARILLDDCRRFGTLPFAHLARSGFVATTLLKDAESAGIITNAARTSFLSSIRTVSHELTSDARAVSQGEISWEDFVTRYGHLRPGTYDITSPRYDMDPERFLRPLVEHAKKSEEPLGNLEPWNLERDKFFESLQNFGLPADPQQVEEFLRQAIQGREYAKFIFSRNLSAALEDFAVIGKLMGLDRNELAHLSLDSLLTLREEGYVKPGTGLRLRELSRTGQERCKIAGASELPPLITQLTDIDAFIIGSDRPNFFGTKSVTADCLDLSREADVETSGRIVLIPQADPGYDWLFGQGIAALITMYGGANSHMAIRAAEFGLPAAIGVGEQKYRQLCNAQVLELDPANQILRIVR